METFAEWVQLTEKKQEGVSGQVAPKPQGGRPEGGLRAATRELGIERTKVVRDEQIAEWIRLTEEKQRQVSGQFGQKPQGGRPEGGVAAASRELGLKRSNVRRATKVADIAPETNVRWNADENFSFAEATATAAAQARASASSSSTPSGASMSAAAKNSR